MCNYYDRHRDPRNLQAAFRFPELPNMEPRYVVRPTNVERVVVEQNGGRHLVSMRWGLVPFWSKDIKTGLTMFNAQMNPILENILRSGRVTDERGADFPLLANMSEAEGGLIDQVIRLVKPDTSLEVGFAYGISTLFACGALDDNRKPCRHVVID